MQPIVVTVGPLASADANIICEAQDPNAGALALDGASVVDGVAILDQPRRVLITTAADETANYFTVTGTGPTGQVQSEILLGPNAGTVQSVLDYKTVTSVVSNEDCNGNVEVGTSEVASSRWIRLDSWAFAQTSVQCNVTGTVNYTVQQTMDDPASPTNPVALADVVWLSCPDTNLVSADASKFGAYDHTPTYVRLTLNSGTGSVTMTLAQSGVTPL